MEKHSIWLTLTLCPVNSILIADGFHCFDGGISGRLRASVFFVLEGK